MLCLRPLDALRLNHPLAEHYRSTAAPIPALTWLQSLLKSEACIITARWRPAEGKVDDDGWTVLPARSAGISQSLTDDNLSGVFYEALALCWDICTAHLPLNDLIDRQWMCCVTQDACFFMPEQVQRDALPETGQDHLARWAEMSRTPNETMLPFLPLAAGRGSMHQEVRIAQDAPQSVLKALHLILPDATGVLDPVTAGRAMTP